VTHADEKQTEIAPLIRRKPKITTELLVEIRRNFEVIDESIRVQEPNTDDFLRGSPPNWGAIAADVDAPRDLKNEILDPILHEPALDRGEAQFVLLHTEAGTGKTTLLRRLGVELALTWDHIVISLKPYGDLEFLDLERLAQLADERIYVLVDDASSQAREISEALSRARHANIKLTILAAARTNEWREIQEGYSFPGFSDFAFEALSDEEIDAIISTLAKHNALGLLAGASREAQIAAFKSKADKQLLVALREATEGKAFDDIVVDEYDRIPSPAGQRAYLLVAALHRLGILTRAGLLHRALNLPLADLGHQVFDPTTKVIVPRDALGESEHYYSTRHQLIAEIVFDRKIGSERRRVEYYADLIGHLDLGYSSDADAYRKFTRSRNKQFLRDFDDVNNRRELMQQLVHIDPTDAFALQHAAMMELDQGNVGPASKYLNRALELRPNDPSIRDTEGRLVLMNANSEQNLYMADGKFARAEEIFTRNIQRRRDEPFGYRHLAETYINWADRQERDGKRLHYISLAYGTLLEGLNKCTSASMLLQYLGELEEKFGNPDKARQSFTHALQGKPGDIITRFMAARLEEKQGDSERALQLLEEGLEVSSAEPELHYRLAVLLAAIRPERDTEIRNHFQAALLGPQRNYRPKLAYGAYLFSRREYRSANDYFRQLDELVVTNKERFEPRRFRFGLLRERHTGRVSRVSYASASVEFDQGATEIYLPMRQIAGNIAQGLQVNRLVSYEIRFNMKGAVGVSISLAG